MIYKEITHCRICGNSNLAPVINLGVQALTGVFPGPGESVESGPLEVVKCISEGADEVCGLVQLRHDYQMEKLYGDNYGYRSGLNKSMVEHLQNIVAKIEGLVKLNSGDLVIDIASNDGTLLAAYKNKELELVGIDPTASKFASYYPNYIKSIPEFFSADIVKNNFGNKKAKVISSIAMFYDLPQPLEIMKQIAEIMDVDGVWVTEQSYLPAMIDNISYDTICHEHLEFYTLRQFKWMADRAGLKIIAVELNNTNGASLALTLAKTDSGYAEATDKIKQMLLNEEQKGMEEMVIYKKFAEQVEVQRIELKKFIEKTLAAGKKILGYGASTKGNVLLQYCGLSPKEIACIADVNEYKFGRHTPGTLIPIVSETEAKNMHPDYFLVLPWHFKNNIIAREKDYLAAGGKLVFPLPRLEII